MKKTLLPLLILGATLLASCGESTPKGVQGKAFTFSSCTAESGDTSTFYNSNNPAGADKEAVVNRIVEALYSHGTAETFTKELSFSTHQGATTYDSGSKAITYNGKSVTPYHVNYVELSENSITYNCDYIALDSDYTSLHFINLDAATATYVDNEFSLGMHYVGDGFASGITYKSTCKDTSVKYDASSKKLTISLVATCVAHTEKSDTSSSVNYTLEFAEK